MGVTYISIGSSINNSLSAKSGTCFHVHCVEMCILNEIKVVCILPQS